MPTVRSPKNNIEATYDLLESDHGRPGCLPLWHHCYRPPCESDTATEITRSLGRLKIPLFRDLPQRLSHTSMIPGPWNGESPARRDLLGSINSAHSKLDSRPPGLWSIR